MNNQKLNLVGQSFGKLIVKEWVPAFNGKAGYWLCICECGNEAHARTGRLLDGSTTCCKDCQYIDLTGQRFGKLVAKEVVGSSSDGMLWFCECDCGNTTIVPSHSLRGGRTKSCGCLAVESAKMRAKHGLYKDRLYRILDNMKQRTTNPNHPSYPNYGGRGIKVCEEWNDPEVFYKWSYETGYEDGLTIERIDPNGDYCPENCRWISLSEQQWNKRTTLRFEYKGETYTVKELSQINGIPERTIRDRITVYGWSVEEAVCIPLLHKKRSTLKKNGDYGKYLNRENNINNGNNRPDQSVLHIQ